MSDELRPCQCKRNPRINRAFINDDIGYRIMVVCSCGMNTDYCESEKDAVEKWNHRPIEDALIEALEDASTRMFSAGLNVHNIQSALALAKGVTK